MAVPVEAVAGLNFTEMRKKAANKLDAQKTKEDKITPADLNTTANTTKAGTVDDLIAEKAAGESTPVVRASAKGMAHPAASADPPLSPIYAIERDGSKPAADINHAAIPIPPSETGSQADVVGEDINTVFLGLRVYTDKAGGAVIIGGELRHEMEAAFAKLRL